MNRFSKIPLFTRVLFGAIFALSLLTVSRDLYSANIGKFGELESVTAQESSTANVTKVKTPSFPETYNGEYKIIDSFGRALVMNPGNKADPIKSVAEVDGKIWGMDLNSKSGVNMGTYSGDLHPIDFISGKGNVSDLGMSFVVISTTNDGNVDSLVNAINEAVDNGKMPVIRLCIGQCNFIVKGSAQTIGESMAKFYLQVAQALEGSDAQFVASLGPNEPGTGNEMADFLLTSDVSYGYSILPEAANIAARLLQGYRGDVMYLAPGIFNITNTQNDDFLEYSKVLDATLFDYLLGNTYVFSDLSAAVFYTDKIGNRSVSVKEYVESNNLGFIVTEFGSFVTNDSPSTGDGGELSVSALDLVKSSYSELCRDQSIDGINFFRPFTEEEYGATIPIPKQGIPSDQVLEITSVCSEVPQKATKSNRWLNANFDSCVAIKSTESNVLGDTDTAKQYCSTISGKNTWLSFGDSLAGNGESMAAETGVEVLSFEGQGALDFLQGHSFYTQSYVDSLNAKLNEENIAAVRIILGTNDCRSGIDQLENFKNAITSITKIIKQKAVPILVTIMGNPSCTGGAELWNAKIREVAISEGAILIDTTSYYSQSDLKDDRHLKNYDKLNFETSEILSSISSSCGITINTGSLPTEDNSSSENLETGVSESIYVNYAGTYGLGGDKKLKSCQVVESKSDSKTSALVVPSGNGFGISLVTYMDVSLPVLSVASANPANSSSVVSSTPLTNFISAQIGTPKEGENFYDSLNQFAEGLDLGEAGTYPVPWLGSLNSSVKSLIYSLKDFNFAGNVPVNYSSNALYQNSIAEIQNDIENNLAVTSTFETSGVYYSDGKIPDERAVCFAKKTNISDIVACLDNKDFASIRQARYSDIGSAKYVSKEEEVSSCPGILISSTNRKNLLPGPKIEVKRVSEQFTGSEICWNYGVRKNNSEIKENWSFKYDKVFSEEDKAKSNLKCSVDPNAVVYRYNRLNVLVPVKCTNLIPVCDFASGTCSFPGEADVKNGCFVYEHKADDEIYKKSSQDPYASWPSQGSLDLNDSLYNLVTFIDTYLGSKGLDLKIPESDNFGWQGLIRQSVHDEGKKNNPKYIPEEVSNAPYYYNGESNEQCVNDKSKFFDNSMPVASTRQSDMYFPLAGWIQILSDMVTGYIANTKLPDVKIAPRQALVAQNQGSLNIAGILGIDTDINSQYIESNFVQSGYASRALSFPLYSCNEIDECKKDSNSPLCPDPLKGIEIPEDKEFTCIKLKDGKSENFIKNYLCQKGFVFQDICGKDPLLYCPVSQTDNSNSDSSSAPVTIEGGGYYVVADTSNSQFFATESYRFKTENILEFSERNQLDFAVNANFYSGDGSPLGMAGQSPNIIFKNINDSDRSGAEFALVWHDGKLKTGDVDNDKFIIFYTDKIAILDTRSKYIMGDNADVFSQKQFDSFKSHIKSAVSGIALLGSKSKIKYAASEYPILRNEVRAATIIGVKDSGKSVVFSVLEAVNFSGIENFVRENNLEYAIIFDAGGSSQIYSKKGFPDSTDIYSNGKVYSPEAEPRTVSIYLGFKNTDNTVLVGSNDFCNCVSNSNAKNLVLGYPVKNVSYGGGTQKISLKNIAADYGRERTLQGWSDYHTGIDWGSPIGEPVIAASGGTVYFVGTDTDSSGNVSGYGNYIKIKHSNGMVTLYGHLSEFLVSAGDTVKKGDVIGKVGNTGRSSGSHIHFELRKNDTCSWDGSLIADNFGSCSIDPKKYLSDLFDESVSAECKDSSSESYNTIMDLAEKVESITNVPSEFLLSILTLESRTDMELTLGEHIKNGDSIYSGNPNDRKSQEGENSYKAAGPYQFVRCYWIPYAVPKDIDPVELRELFPDCADSNYNTAGRNYDEVLNCVKEIGMSIEYGQILNRELIGHSMCAMAVKSSGFFKDYSESVFQTFSVEDRSSFNENNPIWNAARYHYCGNVALGNGAGECSYGYWYSDAAWGRANVFNKFKDELKSGDIEFSQVFYYSDTLEIECVNRSYDKVNDCR